MKKNIFKLFIVTLLIIIYTINLYAQTNTVVPTIKISDDIYAVKDAFVNMYLYKIEDKYIAVDAGNNLNKVERELKKLNIDNDNIIALFITHVDTDHTRAVNFFKNADVYVSEEAVQMMNGEIKRKYSKNLDCDYKLVNDGDIVSKKGINIKCISTPGHTPESMSFLINDIYLFTGDLLSFQKGKVVPFSFSQYNMDTELMKKSIKKLSKHTGVKYVFTGHHGYTNNFEKCFED